MSPETWVHLRSRVSRSGNSLKRGLRVPVTSGRISSLISTTLQSFLGGWDRDLAKRRKGARGLGPSVENLVGQFGAQWFEPLWWRSNESRLLSHVILMSENSPFLYISFFPTVGYPQKTRQKLLKGSPLCRKVSISHLSRGTSPRVATLPIPASARPPSTVPPGDKAPQSASICLGHPQLHWSSGTTMTAKLQIFVICFASWPRRLW